MSKHFLMVTIIAALASLAIRLWITNYPVTARQAGLQ